MSYSDTISQVLAVIAAIGLLIIAADIALMKLVNTMTINYWYDLIISIVTHLRSLDSTLLELNSLSYSSGHYCSSSNYYCY